MDTAGLLDLTLRAQAVPIIGVSIGLMADRATWKVQYDPSATDAQKTTAVTIVATFDPTAPSVTTAALDRDAMGATQQNIIKALLAEMLEKSLGRVLTTADIPALQAMFQRTIVYYKFIVNNGL